MDPASARLPLSRGSRALSEFVAAPFGTIYAKASESEASRERSEFVAARSEAILAKASKLRSRLRAL
jgi:hypothetical protein